MLEWNEILLRLGLAIVFGGLVGFERERKDWAVGIRTHMLACMGAALIMMVSAFGFSDILGTPNVELDPSRVASSVIIGIGYLGAGIILVLKPGNIKGLTTASALWTTAGIGLACGGGLYLTAGAATFFMLAILYGMQELQRKFSMVSVRDSLKIFVARNAEVNDVIGKIAKMPIKISGVTVKKKRGSCAISVVITSSGDIDSSALISEIQQMPQVTEVRWN